MTSLMCAAVVGLICAATAPAAAPARRRSAMTATVCAPVVALVADAWLALAWALAVVAVTARALPRTADGSAGDRPGRALSCAVVCGGASVGLDVGRPADLAVFSAAAAAGCALATTSVAGAWRRTTTAGLLHAGLRLSVALQLLVAWAGASA